MSDEPGLTDQQARIAIATEFDRTLFVEAGAGSGKTKSLVDRVRGLICVEGVDVTSIAAITFTEKAAAELRDRIRRELEAATRDGADAETRTRADRALHDLDGAAIGTLHSFAQRLLTQRAIEAGLPPRLEILDEVGSDVNFSERWTTFIDGLLDDPAAARPVQICFARSILPEHFRVLAEKFEDNWDLLEAPLSSSAPPSPPQFDAALVAAEIERVVDDVLAMPEILTNTGTVHSGAARQLDRWRDVARAIASAPTETAAIAAWDPTLPTGLYAKKAADHPGRDAMEALHSHISRLASDVVLGAVAWIGWRIGRFVLDGADERRDDGTLEFHDLLVLARRMLRNPTHGAEVRRSLGRRYRKLLLDEFQDTDPIQIEIAVLLAASDPTDERLTTLPWEHIAVEPGRLFFVGDPKQSIYRFRRADISLFLKAGGVFGPPLPLTTNFRSQRAVIDFVNVICGGLIHEVPGSQPAYQALAPRHDDHLVGPLVALFDGVHDSVGEARHAESRDVAATVRAIIDDGWTVTDGPAPDDGSPRPTRPALRSDICILLPGRTSLDPLLNALEDAEVPYRTEAASLVYAAEEIREIMATLRAVNDPTDSLATVTALRSSLFGCGDDDLVHWYLELGGKWNLQTPLPEGADGTPVGDAMAFLRHLHDRRHVSTPAELIEELVAARFGYEVAAVRGRYRDRWRRLRFVIDQARAWATVGDGTLRGYLQWVKLQSARGSRVSESVLPETDNDAVRIMTIHAAKGLEFPIVIAAGLNTQPRHQLAKVDAVFDGGTIHYRAGKDTQSDAYTAQLDIDEQMGDDERRRLLYVALTRAEDHLVVSIRRPDKDGGSLAGQVAELVANLADPPPTLAPEWVVTVPGTTSSDGTTAALPDFGSWLAERDAALSASRRRATVSATAIARFEPSAAEDTSPEVLDDEGDTAVDPGVQKQGRDLDLPPWQKGRYGTAVGRAVHGVMQSVDLITGEGIDAAVASQAAAEGLIGRERVIHRLAASGLASEAVRTARGLPHWKEMFVAAPLPDGTTIEGYIDLVYRAIDGLVIVDYKTDAVPDDESLAAKVEVYRIQLAAYAVALEQVLGEQVARCQLVFLREEGSQTVDIADLDTAKTEAAERAAALANA